MFKMIFATLLILCLLSPAHAQKRELADGSDFNPQLSAQLVKEGALLIDVRTLAEFRRGHINNAMHIPLNELSMRVKEIEKRLGGDKSKPIVLYCQSGRRSGVAKEKLRKLGYRTVVNHGGIATWSK